MIRHLLNSKGLWQNGLAIIRMITGAFLIYHSTQALETADMEGFAKWLDDRHFPFPAFMAYAGKGAELLGGVCLVLGLFTRLATILLICTFSFITFVMGGGKIFTDAQHPFMFVLMALVFLFSGPGKWSLDERFFNRSKTD